MKKIKKIKKIEEKLTVDHELSRIRENVWKSGKSERGGETERERKDSHEEGYNYKLNNTPDSVTKKNPGKMFHTIQVPKDAIIIYMSEYIEDGSGFQIEGRQ